MKSIHILSILTLGALAATTSALAAGPAGGRAAAPSAGTQLRVHTPGTGLVTGTPTQDRLRTPGVAAGPAAGDAAAQAARRGQGNGIHVPGTGRTPVPATPATSTP